LGSAITGALFTIGKTALAFFFGKFAPASVYGTAGSIILILLWVSYSSIITFLVTEFTATYAKIFSGKVPHVEFVNEKVPQKQNWNCSYILYFIIS
jgi:membrane protein